MFTNNLIEQRVMAAVKAKIETAQKEYNDGIFDLKENSRIELAMIKSRLKEDKIKLADTVVEKILNKIL